VYFAVPAQPPKEQFDCFAALCVWLMRAHVGSDVEAPSDCDAPPAVADGLVLALAAIGFKRSFAPARLVPGHGLEVSPNAATATDGMSAHKCMFPPTGLRGRCREDQKARTGVTVGSRGHAFRGRADYGSRDLALGELTFKGQLT
jgi:hypothetical protein